MSARAKWRGGFACQSRRWSRPQATLGFLCGFRVQPHAQNGSLVPRRRVKPSPSTFSPPALSLFCACVRAGGAALACRQAALSGCLSERLHGLREGGNGDTTLLPCFPVQWRNLEHTQGGSGCCGRRCELATAGFFFKEKCNNVESKQEKKTGREAEMNSVFLPQGKYQAN